LISIWPEHLFDLLNCPGCIRSYELTTIAPGQQYPPLQTNSPVIMPQYQKCAGSINKDREEDEGGDRGKLLQDKEHEDHKEGEVEV